MPTESLLIPAPVVGEPAVRYRYRLRFAKTGDLRLVSHHDLMHVLERMMRRAEIPFAVTQGFHPQPKMSFALSLALGVVGRNEVFDLETTRDLPADELRERLNRVSPTGLSFSSCIKQEKKPSSQVRRMFYRVELSAPQRGEGSQTPTLDDVHLRIDNFLALTEHWIHRTRPQPRRLNIRPFVESLTADVSSLSMVLWVAQIGAARPEEILAALGLSTLLDEGAVLERSHLELLGELPEHERFVPDLATASAPSPKTPNDPAVVGDERGGQRSADAPLPTSLIANPLSFDS